MLLIIVLTGDVRRPGELRRMVGGLGEKMLSQTLKRLEAQGLVHRKSDKTVPPHAEYALIHWEDVWARELRQWPTVSIPSFLTSWMHSVRPLRPSMVKPQISFAPTDGANLLNRAVKDGTGERG